MGKERVSLLFAWGTERWVVHSQVAGTEIIFEGGRLGSFATPRWSEKDGVGGFFLLRTFDTMGQFIQEIFGAEIGEVERGHGLLRLRRFGGSVLVWLKRRWVFLLPHIRDSLT